MAKRRYRKRRLAGECKCTKCGWCGTPEAAKDHKCHRATVATNSLVTASYKDKGLRAKQQGAVQTAYGRGYQAGYQDRVMGRKPDMYAHVTRKEVRENEGG